jgi:two-component system, OmpR family, sensor histidine kinase TctE
VKLQRAWGPFSLRQRLLLWVLLPLLLVMLVHAWWSYDRAVQVANDAHDRSLYLAARTLAEELAWEQGMLQMDLLRGAGYLFENHTGARLFYRVDDAAGRWLAGNIAVPQLPDSRTDEGGVHFFSLVRFGDGVYQGEAVRLVRLVHVAAGTGPKDPTLSITIAETREAREQLTAQVLRETLLGQGVLLLGALLLVLYGVQRGLRPLDAYRRTLEERSDDDFTPVTVPDVPHELRPLFASLNGYVARLGRLIDIRKRFIDNAAHQLRTPLTVLKTQLTLLSRLPASPSQNDLVQAATQTANGAVQLTEQLLTLTRAEHAAEWQHNETVDMLALAKQVAQERLLDAHAQDIDLGFESEVLQCQLQGHPILLHEALANLVDNAILHGGAGASVTVRVGEHWVEVEDNGPGIAPEHQAHVFERFYRAPASPQAVQGSGLGLAIVREIASQHGAQVELVSPVAAGRGTRLRITWVGL